MTEGDEQLGGRPETRARVPSRGQTAQAGYPRLAGKYFKLNRTLQRAIEEWLLHPDWQVIPDDGSSRSVHPPRL
jgi:hypothetical protein